MLILWGNWTRHKVINVDKLMIRYMEKPFTHLCELVSARRTLLYLAWSFLLERTVGIDLNLSTWLCLQDTWWPWTRNGEVLLTSQTTANSEKYELGRKDSEYLVLDILRERGWLPVHGDGIGKYQYQWHHLDANELSVFNAPWYLLWYIVQLFAYKESQV